MTNNKDSELKIRCTQADKKCIAEKAKSAGKSLSEFTREMLLKGKVVAAPQFSEMQQIGIKLLYQYANRFTYIGNFMKSRDSKLYTETQSLVKEIREVIEQFFKA